MMEKTVSKPNGTLPKQPQSNKAKRLAQMLSALCLLSLMTGCVTTRTTATDRKSVCAAWRAITYSAKGDTRMTIDQVRVHNAVGRKLGCWK